MRLMPAESVDVVFADPPYRLSSGGVSVRSGRLVPVDKGGWDRPMGLEKDHEFNVRWLRATRRVLKPEGTLWVSGTHHIIFSIGFALQRLGFKIINQIAWSKPDPVPNALHTAFTHAHETLIWASKGRGVRHTFNYDLINSPNPNAQVSSVWRIPTVPRNRCASCGAPCCLLPARVTSSSTRSPVREPRVSRPRNSTASSSGRSWKKSSPSSPPGA